jgi:hypothetical protein
MNVVKYFDTVKHKKDEHLGKVIADLPDEIDEVKFKLNFVWSKYIL